MHNKIRTDLALEARELWREGAAETDVLPGVEADEETVGGCRISRVRIINEQGEAALCKPAGSYVTIEIDGLLRREENSFSEAAEILATELRGMLKMVKKDSIFVAGLGNEAITPDAIGPDTIENVMVTRHLKEHMPEDFEPFRSVSGVRTGVLGNTGIESADLTAALSRLVAPDSVIAVDALASRRMDRLCRTVQISDTGIVPGSGVGNSRTALNRETLGVPVIAIGVPTVVDATTLAVELAGRAGVEELDTDKFGEAGSMMVTPRNIDQSVRDISKLIGYGINLALHDGLTIEDIDMFLS